MAFEIFPVDCTLGRRLFLIIAVLCLASGCRQRDQWQRVVVSGSVTNRGEPVVTGRIRFEPMGQTAGPVSIGVIENGFYRYDRLGGVPVGSHRVRIYASDPNDPNGGGPGGPPPTELIAPKYNAHSELIAELDGKKRAVVRDFDLE